MVEISRRRFVARTSALLAGAAASTMWTPALARARAQTAGTVLRPGGTTLERSLVPTGDGPYFRLSEAPGWPFIVRDELAPPQVGREDRRVAVASIAQLTDVHIIDTQAPTRVEFVDRDADPPQQSIPFDAAYRGQETLTTQVADAMNQQLRQVAVGPVTGRPFDVAVSTGDNIDNQQHNELEWFLAVLDGGEVTPNSGDPSRYEGVQDDEAAWYDTHYWHPDPTSNPQGADNYRKFYGWGDHEGLLDAAIQPFTAVGVGVPWFSAYGNHDGLLSGNLQGNDALTAYNTGPFKFQSRPAGMTSGDLLQGLSSQDPTVLAGLLAAPGRPVTPDPARRFVLPREWVQMHLDSPVLPGPKGHGYTQENLDAGTLYFTFEVAPGVLGIVLDTVNRGGYAEGSIGRVQLAWLEARLLEVSSRYFDAAGQEQGQDVEDRLVLLFSHHNSPTMVNVFPDPAAPSDERVLGEEFVAFLHRFPNVVGWINGHTHAHKIWPRPSTILDSGGFWEINTAAHVDWPEQARIIELVDNADGTLSFFATLVDHAGPPRAADGGRDVLSLAATSRELSVNDPQANLAARSGELTDRNVELVIARPFVPATAPPPPAAPPAPTPPAALPATGGGLAASAAAVAVAGAMALRRRPAPGAGGPDPAAPGA